MALPDTREDTAVDGANVKPSTINAIQDAIIGLWLKMKGGYRQPYKKILSPMEFRPDGASSASDADVSRVNGIWTIGTPGYSGAWRRELPLEVGDRILAVRLYCQFKSSTGSLSLAIYNDERTDPVPDIVGSDSITAAGELEIDLSATPITVEEDDYYSLALSTPDEDVYLTYLEVEVDHPV